MCWLGSALDDLKRFPEDARREAGYDLRRIQSGLDPRNWKPMKTVGAGVREIRIADSSGAFRVFYVIERLDAVYVLHAFQKKSQKTEQKDIDKGKARYQLIE
ncbi:type II toxin-antitoxin system RelE/ParE family toxin [Lysobacter sp. MMG2]|uniref:type II toxin-antitoxin system RelE/ParE family toxin n=1 Tax=Lysobacter sp. MMG2 TaxID=2801338 RepID=UPI001C22633C|nr:type II toxin-antitoxin system RelE/ParE family toxin [Lysobacter sp. MMG2]MBU8977669.1 type II toxin-antitoxin system RelE/ParE family toxin [Lysobacter sp. MMG2]